MFSRLFRQRRRITVLILAAQLGSAIAFENAFGAIWGALAGFVVACCIITLVPKRRRWIEAMALGYIIAALVGLTGADWGALGLVGTAMAIAVLTHRLFNSPWVDGLPLRLGLKSHRVSRIRASPAQVWAALIPGESHPDDYWTGTLADFDHDPDDPLTVYLRFRGPDGFHEEVTVTFLDHVPRQRCRYVVDRMADHFAETGTMLIEIAATGTGECQITSRLSYTTLPPRIFLGRWLDDTFGDEWDSFAAMVSARRDWSIHGLQTGRMALAYH